MFQRTGVVCWCVCVREREVVEIDTDRGGLRQDSDTDVDDAPVSSPEAD